MALQKSWPTQFGLTVNSAYIRVLSAQINFEEGILDVLVGVWADETAFNDRKPPLDRVSLSRDVPSPFPTNPLNALYTWLQTRPEFTGSTTV